MQYCNTRTSEQASGRAKERTWGEQENWGDEREGGGGGEKKESPAANPKYFTELRSPTNGKQ